MYKRILMTVTCLMLLMLGAMPTALAEPYLLVVGQSQANLVAAHITAYPNVPPGADFNLSTPTIVAANDAEDHYFLEITPDIDFYLKNEPTNDFRNYVASQLAIPHARVVPTTNPAELEKAFEGNRMYWHGKTLFIDSENRVAVRDANGLVTNPTCWNNDTNQNEPCYNSEMFGQFMYAALLQNDKLTYDALRAKMRELLQIRTTDQGYSFAFYANGLDPIKRISTAADGDYWGAYNDYLAYQKWGGQDYLDNANAVLASIKQYGVFNYLDRDGNVKYILAAGLPKDSEIEANIAPPSGDHGPHRTWYFPNYFNRSLFKLAQIHDPANAAYWAKVLADNDEVINACSLIHAHGMSPQACNLKNITTGEWQALIAYIVEKSHITSNDPHYIFDSERNGMLFDAPEALYNADPAAIAALNTNYNKYDEAYAADGFLPGGWNTNGSKGVSNSNGGNLAHAVRRKALGDNATVEALWNNQLKPDIVIAPNSMAYVKNNSNHPDITTRVGHYILSTLYLMELGGYKP